MLDVRTTAEFDRWLKRLRDQRGRALILSRIKRLTVGLAGDMRAIEPGLSELRIDFGPGYRVYCKRVGASVVLLLGGDKGSQQRDIAKARRLSSELDK
jgi:putative addiction module killer protein